MPITVQKTIFNACAILEFFLFIIYKHTPRLTQTNVKENMHDQNTHQTYPACVRECCDIHIEIEVFHVPSYLFGKKDLLFSQIIPIRRENITKFGTYITS